jgi:hypothetical protein
MIALGWTLPDSQRATGRLSKYNPERRKTFAIADWVRVCRATGAKLAAEGAMELTAWTEAAASKPKPTKNDQDRLDACLCLVAALHLAKGRDALFVGCYHGLHRSTELGPAPNRACDQARGAGARSIPMGARLPAGGRQRGYGAGRFKSADGVSSDPSVASGAQMGAVSKAESDDAISTGASPYSGEPTVLARAWRDRARNRRTRRHDDLVEREESYASLYCR